MPVQRERRPNFRRFRNLSRRSQEPVESVHYVVVKFRDDIHVEYVDHAEGQIEAYFPWKQLARLYEGIELFRLYRSMEPKQIQDLVDEAIRRNPKYRERAPNFLTFFRTQVPSQWNPERVAETILELSRKSDNSVETAYYDPQGGSPYWAGGEARCSKSHLDDQGVGINLQAARNAGRGGDGAGQNFFDIEQGWTFDHQALGLVTTNPATGAVTTPLFSGLLRDVERPHGTAALGIICAKSNPKNIQGIAPGVATIGAISIVTSLRNSNVHPPTSLAMNIPDAILAATDPLNPLLPFGGVLLIEVDLTDNLHKPVEAMYATWHNILLATNLGITVVEAAGNGKLNLDKDIKYKLPDAGKGFVGDPILSRVLDPNGFWDSGAIMVGASSCDSPHMIGGGSNYGSRIDCYAWGESVQTCSSTDAAARNAPKFAIDAYVHDFGGTSSASAIIAGAALVVQGLRELEFGKRRLDADQMRSLLADQNTGTLSADPIGVMPDLGMVIPHIPGIPPAP